MNDAYIAGFFDADGCITTYLSGGRPQLTACFTQKNKRILKEIQKALGYGTFYVNNNKTWSLNIRAKDQNDFFDRMLYYVKLKWNEVRIAKEYRRVTPLGRKSPQSIEYRKYLVEMMRHWRNRR